MEKLKDKIIQIILFLVIVLNLYFILWLWDKALLGTFPEWIYFLLFVPFCIWSIWIIRKTIKANKDLKEASNNNYQKINTILIKFTKWTIWLSLLILVLHFFNLFHDFGIFYIIFLIIIGVNLYLFFIDNGLQVVDIIYLLFLNILGVLFHYPYFKGIDSKDYKELYYAYNELENFDKKAYYLKLIIEDSNKYNLTPDEVYDIIDNNKSYNKDTIFESEHNYPLEYKSFSFTEHDSLVNHIIYEIIDTSSNYDYSIFQKWLIYLSKYGHYEKAIEFSKEYEKILMKKLYEFNDWEENFDLLKRGILSMEKLFPENKKDSRKWVKTFIRLKKFQYHYYKYKKNEELMSVILSEYYKIDMHSKKNN